MAYPGSAASASFRGPYSVLAFVPASAYSLAIVVEDASDMPPSFAGLPYLAAAFAGRAVDVAAQAAAVVRAAALVVASAAAFADTCWVASDPYAEAFVPSVEASSGQLQRDHQPSHWDWGMDEGWKAIARILDYILEAYFAYIDLVVVCHVRKELGMLVSHHHQTAVGQVRRDVATR